MFLQILDSSIAENFTVRHVFEDFLKLADREGIVDMTHSAIARRLNVPEPTIRECIAVLEAPDPNSRDPKSQGRRIERLSEHRDWGWRIINWGEYEKIRDRAQANERLIRHRAKKAAVTKSNGVTPGNAPEPTGPQSDPLEIPENLKTPLFVNKWQVWMNQRRGHHKVKDWVTYFREQLDWLSEMGPERAVATLTQGILGNHQGLFQVNGNGSKPTQLRGGTMAKPGENF